MKKEQSSILTPNNKLVGVKPTKKKNQNYQSRLAGDF